MSLFIFIALLSTILVAVGSATQMDSANYNQTKSAVAGGGDSVSSTNYASTVTIGEIAGSTTSTNYDFDAGFQADGFGANTAPVVNSLILNATDNPLNTSSANLTAYVTASDADGDNISYAWDWRKENVSIMVVNMNFDVNDSAGTGKTKDYTTFSNNGTLGNGTVGTEPTWNATGGWNGTGAYTFDGIDDVITINDSDDLSFGDGTTDQPFSVSAWVNLDTLGYNTALLGKASGPFAGEYYILMEDNDLYFMIVDDSANKRMSAAKANSLTPGNWYHVVGTYDGSGETSGINLYLDGVATTSKTKESGFIAMENTDEPLVIGRRDGFTNGTIDEARIWDFELSEDQARALYNDKNDLFVSQGTSKGENWSICVTPNDGTEDGSEVCSNEVEIQNSAPEVSSVILNATDNPLNTTTANLTTYTTATDADGDNISYAYDWRKENTSIAVLNMNFDVDNSAGSGKTKDHTIYKNNGTLGNGTAGTEPTWNATGGWNGTGAYEFDGVDDVIALDNYLTTGALSITAWIKPATMGNSLYPRIIDNGQLLFGLRNNTGHQRFWFSGNGSGLAVSSNDVISMNVWNFVSVTINESGYSTLYINGAVTGTPDYFTGTAAQGAYLPLIGTDNAASYSFDGAIDSLIVWNRTLSPEQILALYNNHSDLIVSDETSLGENWSVCVTPNDGTEDGSMVCTEEIEIQEFLNPPKIQYVTPTPANDANISRADADFRIEINVTDLEEISWTWNGTSYSPYDDSLILWYNLDNNSNIGESYSSSDSTIVDITNTYNGTSKNGVAQRSITGRWDGALNFSGSTDYIDSGYNLQQDENHSISAWIYLPETPGNTLFGKETTGSTYYNYFVTVYGGVIDFWSWGGSGQVARYTLNASTDYNSWHHLVITSDITAQEKKIYLDGKKGTDGSYAGVLASDGNIYLGARNTNDGTPQWYYTGSIDEFTIWDQVLTQEEINQLYSLRVKKYDNDTYYLEVNQTKNGTAELDFGTYTYQASATNARATNTTEERTVTIGNAIPISSVIMNATDNPTNSTNANLTAYVTASDADGDDISYAWDWRKENVSIATVNMNFDVEDSAGAGKTKDYTTYMNNGTVNNASWTATGGWNGTGTYDFNESYIDLGNDSLFNSFGNLTIALWANVDSTGASQTVVAKDSDTGGRSFTVDFHSTAVYRFYINGGADGDIITSSSTYGAGEWHHVVGVYNTAGTLDIYVDGQSAATQVTNVVTSIPSSTAHVTIGRRNYTDFEDAFDGHIDNVMIFNRSLSAEQISSLFNNQSYLIVSDETNGDENWSVCVTPNDGSDDGSEACSDEIQLSENTEPSISSLVINATDNPTNSTDANLTAYVTATDDDGDNISYAWDWRTENTSIAVLNMNFDVEDSAGSGKTKDYTTYSNNGTVTSATWNASGGWNSTGAYEFGSGKFISVGDIGPFTDYTVAAWINSEGAGDGVAQRIVTKTPEGDHYELALLIEEVIDRYVCYLENNGDGNSVKLSSTTTAVANRNSWMHVGCTFNDEGNNFSLYVNGILENSSTTALSIPNTAEEAVIGVLRYDAPTVNYFVGTIDDVLISDSTLSPNQILALYDNRSDLIVSQETTAGENWSVCVTPNDGAEDGSEVCSNEVEIQNRAPIINSLIMNATDNPTNSTNANLTAYVTASDADGDDISYAWDWRTENTSIAVLNMNFDVEDSAGSGKTKDYTTRGNDGTITGTTWNTTGGWNNTGAYEFDGENDYITTPMLFSEDKDPLTFIAWIKANSFNETENALYGEFVSTSYEVRNYISFNGSGAIQFDQYTPSGGVAKSSDGIIELDKWIHVALVKESDRVIFYKNGVLDSNVSHSETYTGVSPTVALLGARAQNSQYDYEFNGIIDNILIFNHSLSTEQILALYNNHSDLIVSDETSVGENWSVCVTPNDGIDDGSEVCSNEVEIQPLSIECTIDADCAAGKACYYGYCFSNTGIFSLLGDGLNVSWIDSFGRMMLAGTASSSQGSCTLTDGGFPVKAGGSIVASIDRQGNFCAKGTISESQSTPLAPPAGGGVLIRNASQDVVAYVDTNGNLVLGADLIESGFN